MLKKHEGSLTGERITKGQDLGSTSACVSVCEIKKEVGLLFGSTTSGSGQAAIEQSHWDIPNQDGPKTRRGGARGGANMSYPLSLSPCVPLKLKL